MSRQVKLGVIGWLEYYDNEHGLTVAACDVNADKLGKFVAEHPDVKPHADWRELVADADIDAVIISVPNWLHCEMAVAFMQAGKDLFLEKPMGINQGEFDAIVRAQRETDKICAVDFEMRVSTGMNRVREIIASGEIGPLVGLEFVHHRGAWLAEDNNVWRTDPARSGGLFLMEICHEVDMFRCLGGEITHVQSFSHPNVLPQYPPNIPDNVCTHVQFESGMMGTILASHTSSAMPAEIQEYADRGHDMYWIITGQTGSIRVEDIKQKILICNYADYHPDAAVGKRVEFTRLEDFTHIENFDHDVRANHLAFLRCCSLGEDFHQSTLDAWRTHVVCLAAERSAVENAPRLEVTYHQP